MASIRNIWTAHIIRKILQQLWAKSDEKIKIHSVVMTLNEILTARQYY
jgi:hypothetical protein